jgi:hypothetical protein
VAVVGRGTGIDDAAWMRKAIAIRDALRRARKVSGDPVALLRTSAGADLAAMAGFLAQAAVRRTPVVLDGMVVTSAAAVAEQLAPGARQWWVAGHRSVEPAHSLVLDHLRLRPLLELDMRLGEGSGAVAALPLVLMAARILTEMATFGDAGVSGPGPATSPSGEPSGADTDRSPGADRSEAGGSGAAGSTTSGSAAAGGPSATIGPGAAGSITGGSELAGGPSATIAPGAAGGATGGSAAAGASGAAVSAGPAGVSGPANSGPNGGPASSPTNPGSPTNSGGLASPSGPTDSRGLASPTGPTNPSGPTDSGGLASPSSPTNPGDPAEPAGPTNPSSLANPAGSAANPGGATNPGGPAASLGSAESSTSEPTTSPGGSNSGAPGITAPRSPTN